MAQCEKQLRRGFSHGWYVLPKSGQQTPRGGMGTSGVFTRVGEEASGCRGHSCAHPAHGERGLERSRSLGGQDGHDKCHSVIRAVDSMDLCGEGTVEPQEPGSMRGPAGAVELSGAFTSGGEADLERALGSLPVVW